MATLVRQFANCRDIYNPIAICCFDSFTWHFAMTCVAPAIRMAAVFFGGVLLISLLNSERGRI